MQTVETNISAKYLKVDEQTISDLGIFGSSGKSSVFELYNKTVTQGGGARLEELFKKPLANADAINEQSQRYQFFSKKEYRFPVDSETIAAMAYYLENNDVRSQLQLGSQSVSQRLKDMVAADAEQVFVHDGVQASIRMFHKVGIFLQQVQKESRGSAYESEYDQLEELINSPVFEDVRQNAGAKFEAKLSISKLSELDKLIRFEQRDRIVAITRLLYDLDVLIAVGQTARTYNFEFASVLSADSDTLRFEQVYHPHVEGAIANDLELNQEHNILFLTGANMAGKSTLMKSVGVALYLGHMGFPLAAKALSFSVRDGIYTSINLADNLSAGASHYYAEVLRVKEVAVELSRGNRLFVIFDELFRGTNVKDAYDATIALTTAFSNKRSSQFIISTHIMEAGEVLRERPLPIKYQYLPTDMQGSIPVYVRILREGITADRQGMVIIQNEGILDMLDQGKKN